MKKNKRHEESTSEEVLFELNWIEFSTQAHEDEKGGSDYSSHLNACMSLNYWELTL